jgi:hypothetical protein
MANWCDDIPSQIDRSQGQQIACQRHN